VSRYCEAGNFRESDKKGLRGGVSARGGRNDKIIHLSYEFRTSKCGRI
jgi:hypothetical protein